MGLFVGAHLDAGGRRHRVDIGWAGEWSGSSDLEELPAKLLQELRLRQSRVFEPSVNLDQTPCEGLP